MPAPKKVDRKPFLDEDDIEVLNKLIANARRSQKGIRPEGDGEEWFGQLVADRLKVKAGNPHAQPFRNSMKPMQCWSWIPFLAWLKK